MTMLDRMRRHRSWLKWSLAIVVVSFVLLYIPSFLGNGPQQGAANNAVVAEVNGQEISAAEFRRVYQQQIQAYRQSYGANVDERLLKQLGIDQRIVQQMVEEQAALSEAKRLGITASDAEVRERILALPAFHENGQFIGDQRYRQVLQMQNPPMRTDEFEDEVRRSIMTEKLQAALTGWMTVSDSDVQKEFNRRNEKVKLAVVSFPADKFREGVVATDADVTRYFEAHQEEFRIPEKRKIRFLTIDQEALRQKASVTGQQIERYYNDNIQQFSTPEQVHAEHILLKTDGKDDAAVKKQAESLLAQAKGGANFEDLAKKYSEDDASKAKGGDLDYFGRGQMVKEFDDAAFAAKPGDIVGPVKTQFGYHIIKVLDHRQAQTKPLAEVRSQIEDQLKFEQAQDQAQKAADSISSQLKSPADFDKVARDHGLTVHESGFFQQDEPIAGIGLAPNVAQEAFSMKIGDVSDPIRTPQGYAFVTVLAKQDSYLPKLDEVKAKVRDAVLKEKAIDAARQKAASVDAAMKSGDFDKAAKDAGVEVKTTDFITRGSQVTDIGQSAAVDAAAFSLPKGGVSDPIVTANGAAIIKVVDKQMPSPSDFAAQKDSLRTELLNQRRNEFYSAYMNKARQRMDIRINREVIAQITA
jgi:peptidyl-prolyl cis-trans isomerase D